MWKTVSKQALVVMLLCVGAVHAASPADPNKVIRTAFEAADDGFDMVRTTNYYSGSVAEAIFETLLTYDYLASPAKLVPKTAEAMPEVSDEGKTYTFRIKPGIYFTPDPAFKGVKRELTAADYAYTFKRMLDPANRSPAANFLDGKLVGMDELVKKAKATGRFDYDAPVAGLQTPDRYTLRVQLLVPDYNFLYVVAYGSFAAVAREVIDAYGLDSGRHPVGTGPYMLKQYTPRSKIVLVANPDYRGFTWDFQSSGSALDDKIVKDMRGKKMPQVGRVEISIIEEEQSIWLALQDGQLDINKLPQLAAPTVLNGDKMKPDFAAKGWQLVRYVEPEITYTLFNLLDPVIGGYSLEKNALRRAIAMAYSVSDEIAQLRMGQGVRSEMIVPQGVAGYDPTYRSSIGYDPVLANKLLDHFGYKRGNDGYRTLPDGKPLVLKMTTEASAAAKTLSEIWKRGLDKIGVRVEFLTGNFADNVKAATECRLMAWGSAWHADFPDGENFLQLLYGPNAKRGNHSCYQSAAYDEMYRKAVVLPPGPERYALYAQMNRQIEADSVWSIHVSRVRNWLARPEVKGFKKHPILHAEWPYIDVEKR